MTKRAFICAAALALTACAHRMELPPGAAYVNLGSSFAAGSGTGAPPEGAPARCHQSIVNYAHLLAARLNLALRDASCGGATSAHLLGAWNELPPQIDAVTPETRLVTITVGGNDLAYTGNLIAASCEPGEVLRAAGMTVPCPAPFPVAADAAERLEQNLVQAVREIRRRAPQARVVLIQYVTLVPQTQCANSRLTEEEATALRAVGVNLAAITTRAATETGATVLRVDELSRDHTTCDADAWSLGFPRDYQESQGAPWHPNRRGMEAIAQQLEQMFRQ